MSERGAFIPNLFANTGHQILFYNPPYDKLRTQAPHADNADAFDYVVLIRPEQLAGTALPPFEEIAHGPTFVLGRIIHR